LQRVLVCLEVETGELVLPPILAIRGDAFITYALDGRRVKRRSPLRAKRQMGLGGHPGPSLRRWKRAPLPQ
jgi:hypothetical protein